MAAEIVMETIYSRPKSLFDIGNSFCPGCSHGTAFKLIAELLDEFDIENKTIAIPPIGCGGLGRAWINVDAYAVGHGRSPACATGIKRVRPENFVFTYQGDGDLGCIGFSEIVHAANRGEKFTTFFVNNVNYGMTGGQMAPTTLIGQKTKTTPYGRDPELHGYPMKMCEIISQLEAPKYVARFALNTPANVRKARAGIKKAIKIQLDGIGYSFVEILSACPTNWGMSPEKCADYINETLIPVYPLGVFKDIKE